MPSRTVLAVVALWCFATPARADLLLQNSKRGHVARDEPDVGPDKLSRDVRHALLDRDAPARIKPQRGERLAARGAPGGKRETRRAEGSPGPGSRKGDAEGSPGPREGSAEGRPAGRV